MHLVGVSKRGLTIVAGAAVIAVSTACAGAAPTPTPTAAPVAAPTPTRAPAAGPTPTPTPRAATPTSTPTAASATPTPAAWPAGARTIEVIASANAFNPSSLTAERGQTLQLVVENRDEVTHLLNQQGRTGSDAVIPPRKTAQFAWTAPQAPGAYTLICSVHATEDMVISVTVQ